MCAVIAAKAVSFAAQGQKNSLISVRVPQCTRDRSKDLTLALEVEVETEGVEKGVQVVEVVQHCLMFLN